MAESQLSKFLTVAAEERIATDHKRFGLLLNQRIEGCCKVLCLAGVQDMQLNPELCRSRTRLSRYWRGKRVGELTSRAMLVAAGIASCINSSRFGATSTFTCRGACEIAIRLT